MTSLVFNKSILPSPAPIIRYDRVKGFVSSPTTNSSGSNLFTIPELKAGIVDSNQIIPIKPIPTDIIPPKDYGPPP